MKLYAVLDVKRADEQPLTPAQKARVAEAVEDAIKNLSCELENHTGRAAEPFELYVGVDSLETAK